MSRDGLNDSKQHTKTLFSTMSDHMLIAFLGAIIISLFILVYAIPKLFTQLENLEIVF